MQQSGMGWQVVWAKAHRGPVEEDKNEQGERDYICKLEPFGQPKGMSVHHRPRQRQNRPGIKGVSGLNRLLLF